MLAKEDLLPLFKREFASTLKVMKAFPEDKISFTPHPRSSTAGRIMSTFVIEMMLIQANVLGDKIDENQRKNYAPDNLTTLISDFEKASGRVVEGVDKMSAADMNKMVDFMGGKFPAGDFMLFMLLDQVHHRGQMSVYIRLAGGKVPSIYGPSADEPMPKP